MERMKLPPKWGKKKKAKTNGEDIGTALVPAVIGQPTKYRPEFVRLAREVCRLGATDNEIARACEVDDSTIRDWRIRYPEFEEATRIGKDEADERVTRSLFQNATGFTFLERKFFVVDKNIEYRDVTTLVKPDTTAQIFWLKNRRPDLWRDKVAVEHGTDRETAVTIENAREILISRVFSIAARLEKAPDSRKADS